MQVHQMIINNSFATKWYILFTYIALLFLKYNTLKSLFWAAKVWNVDKPGLTIPINQIKNWDISNQAELVLWMSDTDILT